MRIIARKKDNFVVRLESGEEFISSLQALAKKEKLRGAWFWAIGSAENIELAYYNVKAKVYRSKKIRGVFETVGIIGNVSRKGQEVIIHAHGTFSRANFTAVAGHIVRCPTAATCEIYLQKTQALRKKFDRATGLNLLTD